MNRFWIVLLVVLLAAPAVLAAPPTDAQEAARLLRLGVDLQRNGRHLEALRVFEDAYGRHQHVKIRYYRMKSFQALGRFREARDVLQEIIGDPQLQDRRKELEQLRTTLDQALKPVPIKLLAPGMRGVSVTVDERVLCGDLPCETQLEPGTWLLIAKARGFLDSTQQVTLVPSREVTEVRFVLSAAPRPDPVQDPIVIPDPVPRPAPPSTVLQWTLIGGGIAAIVGSAGYWAKHAIDKGDLRPGDRQTPINLILGGVFTGIGAAGIITGVVLMPSEDGDGGTVSIGGRF